MLIMTARRVRSLAVFGGSGATGRQIIERAVIKGLRVRTLVRDPGTFEAPAAAVEVVTGSLLDPVDVERTLCGCDAVCCAFGPRLPFTGVFCAQATLVIIEAMQRCKVGRIICQTEAMIGNYPQNRTRPLQAMAWLFNKLDPTMAEDRTGQERVVMESGLKWTIVKPPRLTDHPATGIYHASPHVRLGLNSAISRADTAMFIIKELMAPEHVQETVFIRRRYREPQRIFTEAKADLAGNYRIMSLPCNRMRREADRR
jgi:putative NADH-flavin reductase